MKLINRTPATRETVSVKHHGVHYTRTWYMDNKVLWRDSQGKVVVRPDALEDEYQKIEKPREFDPNVIILENITLNSELQDALENPWGSGSLIVGFGLVLDEGEDDHDYLTGDDLEGCDLIKIPYDEIREIKGLDTEETECAICVITCDTTEGIKRVQLTDIVFIGDFKEWAKGHKTINYIG